MVCHGFHYCKIIKKLLIPFFRIRKLMKKTKYIYYHIITTCCTRRPIIIDSILGFSLQVPLINNATIIITLYNGPPHHVVIWLADFGRFCCLVSYSISVAYTVCTYNDKSILFRTGKLKFYGVGYILY